LVFPKLGVCPGTPREGCLEFILVGEHAVRFPSELWVLFFLLIFILGPRVHFADAPEFLHRNRFVSFKDVHPPLRYVQANVDPFIFDFHCERGVDHQKICPQETPRFFFFWARVEFVLGGLHWRRNCGWLQGRRVQER
jgi:hypothetical protein